MVDDTPTDAEDATESPSGPSSSAGEGEPGNGRTPDSGDAERKTKPEGPEREPAGLDEAPTGASGEEHRDADRPPDEPLIRVEGIHKSFGALDVLQGVDLEISKGESLVIIGSSGSGKSVLIKHIIGLLHPDRGQVVVEGQVVHELERDGIVALRSRMGMLFQYAALFDSMTVGENVAFMLRQHTDWAQDRITERVAEVLDWVGLEGTEDKAPADLSGGMKKRVGLARAIVLDPDIILYDEPTTGLDPILSDQINDLILDMQERCHATSVTITHDMVSAYKVADRIAMLYKGRIQAVGTPEEIQDSDDEVVQQFINGRAEGPITEM